MKRARFHTSILVLTGLLLLPLAAYGYVQGASDPDASKLLLGQKMKINGVVEKREPGAFLLRDDYDRRYEVVITDETEIRERKKNIFRKARYYAAPELVRGLNVEVEGRGDDFGRLVAKKIKFTHTEFRIANAVESRVKPMEWRLKESEQRLLQNEQNAEHLSGQLEEVGSISGQAWEGAKSAQDTADEAISGLKAVNRLIAETKAETNERIAALDEYELKSSATVYFKAGSAELSEDGKHLLRGIAQETKSEKGFMIEVAGYASSDGSVALNKALSQKRAMAVVDFLAVSELVPLRRIITPFGYGENMPAADNTTRNGREQNRRVEIKLLVNRGLSASAKVSLVNQ
jgi:outer membrane protein OmpA-like peptidoglycan-associated protein